MPVSHLKSTFEAGWSTRPKILDASSRQTFRANDQVNHLLFCAWNQAAGRFHPEKPYSRGSHYNISSSNVEEVCSLIRSQSVPQICLNDSEANDDPKKCFDAIREALDAILPEKSQFEL